jgi:uncharacterized protein (DUF1330 family)
MPTIRHVAGCSLLALGMAAAGVGAAKAVTIYVIDEVEVTDAANYKLYVDRQVPLIKAAGGTFIVQGGALTSIEGAPPAPRVVIYTFDSLEKLMAWRNGPQQPELIAMRGKYSHFRSFSVEGLKN